MNITSTHTNLQQLTEHISDWHSDHVTIDADQQIIRNIALTGHDSKNGYHYSEAALQEAVSLYESKPVFLDHATNRTRPHDRSTRDLVGSIINPRFEENRIRGDIQTLDTEAGRTFIALAKTTSPAVGMSHVVLAERSQDRTIVEKIHEVVSVDAVVFPATTATFSESESSCSTTKEVTNPTPFPGTMEAVLQEIDLQLPGHLHRLTGDSSAIARRVGLFSDRVIVEICETENETIAYHELSWSVEQGHVTLSEKIVPVELESLRSNDLQEKFFTENRRHSQLKQKLESVTEERNGLRQRIDQNVREQHRKKQTEDVEQLLENSALPASAIDNHFRQQLIETTNSKQRSQLIEDRQRLVRVLSTISPYSSERGDLHQQTTDESFISALQGKIPSML